MFHIDFEFFFIFKMLVFLAIAKNVEAYVIYNLMKFMDNNYLHSKHRNDEEQE